MRGGSIFEPRTRGCTWYLNKDLAQGDERRADLRHEQAADEEVTLVLPEELWNQTKHANTQEPARRTRQHLGSTILSTLPPPSGSTAGQRSAETERTERGRLQRRQPPDALDVLLSFNINSTAVK